LIALPDGKLLLHGGVGASSTATADAFVLDTKQTPWSWSKTPMSTTSLATPALAWHSAVLAGDTVVVSYGLDMNDQTATSRPDEIYFFSDDGKGWTWATSFTPQDKADPKKANSSPNQSSSSSSSNGANPHGGSSHPLSSNPQPSGKPPVAAGPPVGPSPTKTIAGALGGVFGAAVLAGLAALYFRCRAAARGERAQQFAPLTAGGRLAAGCSPPPVSRLLFTHPVPQRILSLGSSASIRSTTRLVDDSLSDSATVSRSYSFGSDMAAVGAGVTRGGRAFDNNNNYEEDREREPSRSAGPMMEWSGVPLSSRGQQVRGGPAGGPLQAGLRRANSQSTTGAASVTSYPFLTSLPVKRSRTIGSDLSASSQRSLSTHATAGVPDTVVGGSDAARVGLDRSKTVRPPNGPRPLLAAASAESNLPRVSEDRRESATAGMQQQHHQLSSFATATTLLPTVAPLRVPLGPRARPEIPGFLRPAGGGGLRVVNASSSVVTSSSSSSSRPSSSEGL
jgi:hypothetical protein